MAMIDALRETGISAPFMTYPDEAFQAVFRRMTIRRPSPLRIRNAEHTWDQTDCIMIWASYRLLTLVSYLSQGLSLEQYENEAQGETHCEICTALLQRIARAGDKERLIENAIPNLPLDFRSDEAYELAKLGEAVPFSFNLFGKTIQLGYDSILDAEIIGD